MKFDPLVKVEGNKLFKLADNSEISTSNIKFVQAENADHEEPCADPATITAVICPWSKVEMEPGAYNEDLLAKLREFLKKLEENGRFAFIVPQAACSFDDADKAGSFIAAMVHAARRIKDATSVVGFAVSPELLEKDSGKSLDENSWSQWFINEMNVKHGHYVYFAENSAVKKFGVEPKTSTNELVLY